MAKKPKRGEGMWDTVTEEDFVNESNIVDEDIAEYNKYGMGVFSANVNLARHIVNVTDSLKPVERRILFAMYKIKATPGHLTKSEKIVAAAMEVHHHGNIALYESLVGMAQYWKKNIPLVCGDCNFGTLINPDKFAASRYTEAELTEYSAECFFEDYSEKVLQMDEQLTGVTEPKYLPSKFPNILVNGTAGIGFGFAACIPPYNCNDIVDLMAKLIKDPNDPDIMMYPDLPTGCDIVDDPEASRSICDTGSGLLRMRARIDIDGDTKPNAWILHIRSIPYTVPYTKIYEQIIKLGKSKALPIDDIYESSVPFEEDGVVKNNIDLGVVIPRSLDPKAIRAMLFKNTDLEKTLPVKFTVIVDDHDIKVCNLRELCLYWLKGRRLYKRSRLNHRINYLKSEIEIRTIMINLCKSDNVEKVIAIIKNNVTEDIITKLCADYGMDSHQAKIVSNKPLSAFSKDAKKRYEEELKKLKEDLKAIEEVFGSPEKQDQIILDELESLRKYATPRKSPIITIAGEEIISDTDHFIVTTEKGKMKKLPNPPDKAHQKNWLGSFDQGDNPKYVLSANNLDTLLVMDTTGKFSILPVYEIPNSIYKETGDTIYSVTKLDGPFVFHLKIRSGASNGKTSKKKPPKFVFDIKNVAIVILTTRGFMKKVSLSDYVYTPQGTPIQSVKGGKSIVLRDGDSVKSAFMWNMNDEEEGFCRFLVYTQRGEYVMVDPTMVTLMGRNAQGNELITVADNDECAGVSVVCDNDEFLVVITAKGFGRREPIEYYQESKKRRDSYKLCSVDDGDTVIFAAGCQTKNVIHVQMKSGIYNIPIEDIPVIPRRGKAAKLIPVAPGDAIIDCYCDLK